jgi:hypothetical protein
MIFVLLLACGGPEAAMDAGVDAGELDAGVDSGPIDAGPPPPMVPIDGWTNAIAPSDIAADITWNGTTYTNMAADPSVVIGPPDGSSGSVALGDTGHYLVADLGVGEEAYDGPGEDIHVLEIDFFTSGVPEPYAVSVSNDGIAFTPIGNATGSHRFDLAGTGVASARYVKVESTRTAEDIVTSGIGSPEWPGAEIDAVGAFYPGSIP